MTLDLIDPFALRLMRGATSASVYATVVPLVHTVGAPDEGNVPTETWVAGASERWLWRALTGSREGGEAAGTEVPLIEAEAWAPLNTALRSTDRVRLTHLHGVALPTPIDYEIVVGPTPDQLRSHVQMRAAP